MACSALGRLTKRISEATGTPVGAELPETATERASDHPNPDFLCSSFPDLDCLRTAHPDCIFIADPTWSVNGRMTVVERGQIHQRMSGG